MQHAKLPGAAPDPRRKGTDVKAHANARRPALFARYAALDRLRYDYPLVLVDDASGKTLFRPLMRVVDEVLSATAEPGPEGEALRQQVLRLEARIRARLAKGGGGTLRALWQQAAGDLLRECGEAPFGPLDSNLDRARDRLRCDGQVIGCDVATPKAVLTHAWAAEHNAKARAFRNKVDGLILRLSDILKADFMKSDEAHGAGALRAAVGQSDGNIIDFGALSGVLARARPVDRLPEARVRQIRWVLSVLGGQRFYGPVRGSESVPGQQEPHGYIFESSAEALDAYRARLPEVLEFVKALTIAELEAENKYRPEQHDPIFASFDESDLTADQVALLPAALVCLRDGENDTSETVRAFEALASGLPIKVLIQTDDILGATSPEPSRQAFGVGSTRLAAMAMGLNNAFAMQASSAHLYRMRGALARGMRYDGPALFCVYSGATPTVRGVAPYLLAAAATESRAFPTFVYDPSAGPDWARRFDLSQNPQIEADWPQHSISYEDAIGQRHSETQAFTFMDFAICDDRYARFVTPHPQAEWHERMVPGGEWLAMAPGSRANVEPYVLGIDAENRLERVVVAARIIAATRRCEDAWQRLQELAGINNSLAERLLRAERAKLEAAALAAAAAAPVAAPAPATPAPAATPAEPAADSAAGAAAPAADLPWIETARCTTCNECTQINGQLFAYNENMQAYVASPDGGSFRQLVEAAESCQVSIIHPGKPRNPDEENLADLIERAKPFN
jgi:hypothetical protein